MDAAMATPPQWAISVGDIGRYSILAASLLFFSSVFGWLFAKRFLGASKWASGLLTSGVVLLFVAFGCLGALFIGNQFEYSYVFEHGDLSNPLQYQIAGIWSGQQGSFLLWACASGLFAVITAAGTDRFRRWFSVAYATFLGLLASIMSFESPFNLNQVGGVTVVPPTGQGLNPSLQNYWVTIHPPTIFLGFGALTVLFAYGFAALMERDYESWLPRVRPWSLVAFSLLGLGLCMGGFWAYETLGWGGFWMWDPVENVSFVPWCLTAAFLHGTTIQSARRTKKMGNLLMAGLPFLCFVYGTFLTRSGFLSDSSVHSFADMDRSALKFLVGLMALAFVAYLGLWATRAYQFSKTASEEPPPKSTPFGREPLLNIGIFTVIALGLATLIGMSIPFVQALRHQPSKVVEEGLYHQVLPWFFIPAMIAMALAPLVPWMNVSFKELAKRAYSVFCVSVAVTGLFLMAIAFGPFSKAVDTKPVVTLLFHKGMPGLPWLLFLVGVCMFAVIANIWRIWEIRKQPGARWTAGLAHIGIAVLMLGLIVSRGFEQHGRLTVMSDHPATALGYLVRYRSMTSTETDRSNRVLFDIYRADKPNQLLFTADPGYYKVGDMDQSVVRPAIEHRPLYDVYFSLQPPQDQSSDPIHLRVGEKLLLGPGASMQYERMEQRGTPGQAGTSFAAVLKLTDGGETRTISPSLILSRTGAPVSKPATLDRHLDVALQGMDASDRSVTVLFRVSSPLFPIEIFHKPLTILVWLGTFITTVAGLLAAAYRRVPSRSRATNESPVTATRRFRRLAKQLP